MSEADRCPFLSERKTSPRRRCNRFLEEGGWPVIPIWKTHNQAEFDQPGGRGGMWVHRSNTCICHHPFQINEPGLFPSLSHHTITPQFFLQTSSIKSTRQLWVSWSPKTLSHGQGEKNSCGKDLSNLRFLEWEKELKPNVQLDEWKPNEEGRSKNVLLGERKGIGES